MENKLVVGMMSGTSADGIDATLVKFESPTDFELLATRFSPFSNDTRAEINRLAHTRQIERCEQSQLHESLAHDYANCALQLIASHGLETQQIDAIANHGQTVRHEPNASPPYSLQLGDPQRIADISGIVTVAQFRQADLSAGGQGAPLMPAFHDALFSGEQRYLLNIGGIANVSQLGKEVIGFDTGPGNTLLDQWIHRCKGLSFDEDGAWARSGTVVVELLEQLLQDEYFHTAHPKSTGPDYFNLDWLGDVTQHKPEDVQATLLALTIESISNDINRLGNSTGEVYVCGGGAHNSALIEGLIEKMPTHEVNITDDIGVPADWMEAIGFAWLGYCKLNNIPSNLPSVTGARKRVELGEVFIPHQA